jgi:hypothetical protein
VKGRRALRKGICKKYIVTWTIAPGTYKGVVARFLETGGAPPAGVNQIGRWHGMSGRGFDVVETTDPKALCSLVAQWADALKIETTPCLEDAEAGAALQALQK